MRTRESTGRHSVPSLVFGLLAVWVLVMLVALVWGVDNAESKLRAATNEALAEGDYGVVVHVSGRDATLYGSVSSEDEAAEIAAMIDAVPGVRDVNSELAIVEPPPPVVVPAWVSMRLVGDAVSIRGSIPDLELEASMIAAAGEQYGEDHVVNGLVVSEDVSEATWQSRVKDVFAHLGELRSGGFRADDSSFAVDGEVISESVRTQIEQELGLIFDELLPVSSSLAIAVLPSPTFSASGSGGVITLEGPFPNQETVDQIADAARRLHPGTTIINSMSVREVAGPPWLEAIDGLLDVVTRLDPWTIDVSEDEVAITGLSLDQDLVGAIGVLTEEVVAGQLSVTTDVQVDPAAIAIQLTELLQGVAVFDAGGATLSDDGTAVLDQAIVVLEASPDAKLTVEGHTDNEGDAAANLELSQQRADAVVAYLVAGGIEPERLTAIGYGEARPIAENVTEEGRLQNRRIEFVIQEGDS